MTETFNRASVALTTTSITDAYQAPNIAAGDRAIVLSCMVANKKVGTTGSVTVTLTITDSANAVLSTWASAVPIPNSASLEAITNKLVLKRGEKIRATAGEASQLDVTISALEIA